MIRKSTIPIIASVLALAFCLGSVEIIARLWQDNIAHSPEGWESLAVRSFRFIWTDDQQLYRFQPNESYAFENVDVSVNSQGLRDAERAIKKQEGEYRILILGDLVVFGWELPMDDTLGRQLETMLAATDDERDYDVINAGIPGWTLTNQLAFLEQAGIAYQPDLVVSVVTVHNDLTGVPDCGIYRKPPSTSVGSWLRENIVVLSLVSHLRQQFLTHESEQGTDHLPDATAEYPFSEDKNDPFWENCVFQPIQQMQNQAHVSGAEFMLVVSPTDPQVRDYDASTIPQDILHEFGIAHDVVVVDLLPIFRRQYMIDSSTEELDSDNPLYADYYSHHSALGNQLAARAVFETLQSVSGRDDIE